MYYCEHCDNQLGHAQGNLWTCRECGTVYAVVDEDTLEELS